MLKANANVWMRALLPGLFLALAAPSLAAAQCMTDDDCADDERCNEPITLETCAQEPCPEPPGAGQCVSELLGEACQSDADCGPDLLCLQLQMAECPEFDPDCGPDETVEGFCDVEGSDAVLAATSGLAPETASAADDTGESAPPATNSGATESSSSGCSVGGAAAGGSTLAWLGLAALVLARRRRR